MTEVAHACTALVEVDAENAFAFLADPKALGGWALGCWDAKVDRKGRFHGRSLFSGEETWGRIERRPCAPRGRLSGRQPAGRPACRGSARAWCRGR